MVLYALIFGVFWNDAIYVAEGHGIFSSLFKRKDWHIQQLAADNKGWAFNNQVRRRQRTVCTLCNELKISNIFYARWPRQICIMSTERQKHQPFKGSMAVNTTAMRELSWTCPCQTLEAWPICQLRSLTAHLSGRSLISSLDPFLDTRRLSIVTGIFHKKLSLERKKLQNYLLTFKRKNPNKNISIALKNWCHKIE